MHPAAHPEEEVLGLEHRGPRVLFAITAFLHFLLCRTRGYPTTRNATQKSIVVTPDLSVVHHHAPRTGTTESDAVRTPFLGVSTAGGT